jgi:hypothetical protein
MPNAAASGPFLTQPWLGTLSLKVIAANRPTDRRARGGRTPSLPPGNLATTPMVIRLAGRVCID